MEWNIQSRAHVCQGCEKGFEDKQHYFTVLIEDRVGYVRRDLCEACWTRGDRSKADKPAGYVSHWQGVYEAPVAKTETLPKENAESLLRKLVEQNDPKYAAACFILAVMLERKRILKVKTQTTRDGKRVFVYEQPKSGDLFTIADPDLQLDQLEQVQREVGHLMEFGVPTDAAPAAAAPSPEAATAPAETAPAPPPQETPAPAGADEAPPAAGTPA